ncbi:hypothetical protein AVEN_149187-1 [Araneus ventricosus]|uniref:Uncharacterized protein n=1 Tax=Araneus ventricosus TaxID=182803 RepID=A0A4Y2KLN6_ARAVE|nr:hypothetical protein AVEN_53760-1 [Araneus ventricosus]GBN03285.1 hypothetical protein AVEN_149187-1 [Araneus ventricosus]
MGFRRSRCICENCKEPVLSLRDEDSARQVVSSAAVAIDTGYLRRNPFRIGRRSFKFVTLAHGALSSKWEGTWNCGKIEETNDQLLSQTDVKY